MESIIIDNCVVTKYPGNGIRIAPIRLLKKINPSLNVDLLQKKTYGGRKNDNLILSQLSDGKLTYADL